MQHSHESEAFEMVIFLGGGGRLVSWHRLRAVLMVFLLYKHKLPEGPGLEMFGFKLLPLPGDEDLIIPLISRCFEAVANKDIAISLA